MTAKSRHILIAVVIAIITIGVCAITILYAPIATPIVAIIGSAAVTWSISKALDRATEHLNVEEPAQQMQTPNITNIEPPHYHTVVLEHHYSERDEQGHHTVENKTETFIEEDPPERPRKPGLSQ